MSNKQQPTKQSADLTAMQNRTDKVVAMNAAAINQPVSTNPLATMVAPATPKVECHTGNVFVFGYDLNGVRVEFYGGGTMRNSVHTADMILVALQSTDYGDVPPMTFKGLSMPSLDKYRNVRIINIAIQDGSAPTFPLVFWEELMANLVSLAHVEPVKTLKVLVRCAGGHGRTGTVLCALAVAANVCPGQDPIAWVRQHYCPKAVETNAQFDYIERLSGIPSKEGFTPPFQQQAWQMWDSGHGVVAKPAQPGLVGMETVGKTTTGFTNSITATEEDDASIEENTISAIWVQKESCWHYATVDGGEFTSEGEPSIFGCYLDDGMYDDCYVDEVWYFGETIMLVLTSGESVYLQQVTTDGLARIVKVDPTTIKESN